MRMDRSIRDRHGQPRTAGSLESGNTARGESRPGKAGTARDTAEQSLDVCLLVLYFSYLMY